MEQRLHLWRGCCFHGVLSLDDGLGVVFETRRQVALAALCLRLVLGRGVREHRVCADVRVCALLLREGSEGFRSVHGCFRLPELQSQVFLLLELLLLETVQLLDACEQVHARADGRGD